MGNTILMHNFKCTYHLSQEESSSFFTESVDAFEEFHEVAAFGLFEYDILLRPLLTLFIQEACFAIFDDFNNMWVPFQFLEHFDLVENI